MAETEVESILREIRERVITQQHGMTSGANWPNGDSRSAPAPVARTSNRVTIAENLALINSYLTTTARAWDRLPPVVSNRSGFAARLELWCKRQLKRGTRWYAWEQVNFNAAVHHALRDLLPLLSAYEHELENLRAETTAAHNAQQIELEQNQSALARLRAELAHLTSAQNAKVEAQLKDLIDELRARDEILHAEQRVCFKQLSLQSGEAATLEDRARRRTETIVAELQSRIEKLEKKDE